MAEGRKTYRVTEGNLVSYEHVLYQAGDTFEATEEAVKGFPCGGLRGGRDTL
jgi:hypothetical protein